MRYDPEKHHRHSIRLEGYDYSRSGAYFVTLCVQHRECLFGDVIGVDLQANDAGQMVERWWRELTRKFPTVSTDESVVMPNHLHGILILQRSHASQVSECPPLGTVMDWFKTMTTNEYIRGVKNHGWRNFPRRLWQRDYFDRIIRDQNEIETVREYIRKNPSQWSQDPENPMRISL